MIKRVVRLNSLHTRFNFIDDDHSVDGRVTHSMLTGVAFSILLLPAACVRV
jgi:hypothetical protein